MLTTIQNKINDESHKSTLTTPDSIEINYYLNEMVNNNCRFCFMEASSHAIDQNRIVGIKIKGAILTNISHDHLDYHSSFKNYINAKKKLFDILDTSSFALVNNDDKRSHYILQNCIAIFLSIPFSIAPSIKSVLNPDIKRFFFFPIARLIKSDCAKVNPPILLAICMTCS